jgi:hypothetical protein
MSKHRVPNDKWIEFISEIATQLTELNFHEDTFETIQDGLSDGTCIVFKEEAQDFYNERYDEVETLLENTLDITNDKPEYYES